MPKSIARRQALADILGIPVALLNLPQLDYYRTQEMSSDKPIHPHTLEAYQDVLVLSWEAYYTSSIQRSDTIVDHWLEHLEQQAKTARGILQHQLLALSCRFLQLSSVIARERGDFNRADSTITESLQLAYHLQNAELIASSICRRARNYVEQQRYAMAVQELETALLYASRSRDPLRSYVSIFLAEVYSLSAPGDAQLAQKSLKLLDTASRAVRTYGTLEGDGSFTKVDTAGLYMLRGDVLRRAGKIEEARNALLIAWNHLSPESTRWRGNLYTSEALLAYDEKDIDGCCRLAIDALNIISATRSESNKTKIMQLYQTLYKDPKVKPSHPLIKKLYARLVGQATIE